MSTNDYSNTDKQKLDAIGTILTDSKTVALANSSNWTQTGVKVTLAEGKWILVATAQFTSNATGRRGLSWRSSAGQFAKSGVSQNAVNGSVTRLQSVLIIESTNEEFEIMASQTSGGELSTTFYYMAVRIG